MYFAIQNVEPSEGRPLQFELSAENQNQETVLFEEVLSQTVLTGYSLFISLNFNFYLIKIYVLAV